MLLAAIKRPVILRQRSRSRKRATPNEGSLHLGCRRRIRHHPRGDRNVALGSNETIPSREAAQEHSPRRKPWVRAKQDSGPQGTGNHKPEPIYSAVRANSANPLIARGTRTYRIRK